MANKGHSRPNLLGGYTHYDEHGKKTGSSQPNLLGGYTDYDAKGHKVGRSDPNLLGGYTHYDNKGHKTGRSDPGLTGYVHYDKSGKRVGKSTPSLLGGYSNEDSEGCYIATCVYGSYDCPEVWTLRRFRDEGLRKSRCGRAFVKVYYRISPMLVRCFGRYDLFRSVNRVWLNRFVKNLKQMGYTDLPYKDRDQVKGW